METGEVFGGSQGGDEGCISQAVALNAEILPCFAHCHLGLGGTCASGLPSSINWSRPVVTDWLPVTLRVCWWPFLAIF